MTAALSFTNTALILSIVAVTLFQPNKARFAAAAIFAAITLSHETLLKEETGILYYGTAALFDLAIMIILVGMVNMTKTALTLQKICLGAILVNFGGFVLWFFYYPPIYYNIAFVVLYSWAVIALIRKDKQDVGHTRTSGLLRPVPGDNSPSHRAI